MTRIEVSRAARIPDRMRLSRYRRSPEHGPRVLFFSGGTAIRKTSRVLKEYSHNTVHLITPFDSGGSSAELRETFGMLSVGDLRNRLIALADETVKGNPEIYRFFTHRFPMEESDVQLRERLVRLVDGEDELARAIPMPLQHIVRTELRVFCDHMPDAFDLRGASLGNLVLAGGYLSNRREIAPVLFWFSALVAVRGVVAPIVDADLHLAAELDNGDTVVGQHQLGGKFGPPVAAPIRRLRLVESLSNPVETEIEIEPKTVAAIESADLVCFPPGSFWSSVVSNLLPKGVGRAVLTNKNPKVYVPSTGFDPEQVGRTATDAVRELHRCIEADAGRAVPVSDVVGLVLFDPSADYSAAVVPEELRDLGITVVPAPLVSERRRERLDPRLLAEALLSLA